MKVTKKRHYIPKFYLKSFSFPNSGKIYCYDKLTGKSYLTNIDNIGHENMFYGIDVLSISDEFEKAISTLEGEFFAPSYRQFVRAKNFAKTTKESRKWFFVFLAFQMFRTNQTRMEIKATKTIS